MKKSKIVIGALALRPRIKPRTSSTGTIMVRLFLIIVVSFDVRDQGKCTASYAFAAANAIEGGRWISTGKKDVLSVQQIIDCSTTFGNNGCTSGSPINSFSYILNNGITSEAKYKYTATKGECRYSIVDKVWEVVKCSKVTPNDDKALESAVLATPTTVMIDGSEKEFQSYKSGLFNPSKCSTTNPNAALVIIGFGSVESGFPIKKKHYFWKAKNSFGIGWGSKGYIEIERNYGKTGSGVCGVNTLGSFPVA